jgi:hypothetical protein
MGIHDLDCLKDTELAAGRVACRATGASGQHARLQTRRPSAQSVGAPPALHATLQLAVAMHVTEHAPAQTTSHVPTVAQRAVPWSPIASVQLAPFLHVASQRAPHCAMQEVELSHAGVQSSPQPRVHMSDSEQVGEQPSPHTISQVV